MAFKNVALLSATLFLAVAARGQAPDPRDYAKKPVFAAMMDDTLANFFEIEKAFNTYFEHHEMPEGENEEIGEHRGREKGVSRRKLRRIDAESGIRFAVKKYHWWHRRTLPFVQPDGRILTPSERIAIYNAQSK